MVGDPVGGRLEVVVVVAIVVAGVVPESSAAIVLVVVVVVAAVAVVLLLLVVETAAGVADDVVVVVVVVALVVVGTGAGVGAKKMVGGAVKVTRSVVSFVLVLARTMETKITNNARINKINKTMTSRSMRRPQILKGPPSMSWVVPFGFPSELEEEAVFLLGEEEEVSLLGTAIMRRGPFSESKEMLSRPKKLRLSFKKLRLSNPMTASSCLLLE